MPASRNLKIVGELSCVLLWTPVDDDFCKTSNVTESAWRRCASGQRFRDRMMQHLRRSDSQRRACRSIRSSPRFALRVTLDLTRFVTVACRQTERGYVHKGGG